MRFSSSRLTGRCDSPERGLEVKERAMVAFDAVLIGIHVGSLISKGTSATIERPSVITDAGVIVVADPPKQFKGDRHERQGTSSEKQDVLVNEVLSKQGGGTGRLGRGEYHEHTIPDDQLQLGSPDGPLPQRAVPTARNSVSLPPGPPRPIGRRARNELV